ncbi:MAG: hypothetical protein ACRDYE_03355, partial [Acidimicrobiales bacterium]
MSEYLAGVPWPLAPATGGVVSADERSGPDEAPAERAPHTPLQRAATAGRARTGARRRALGISAAAYLLLAVLLWWHVWSSHPTSVTTCGCGDSSLFTWFLAWPAYAMAHGLDPLYSTALFHPAGVNLLANTAEVGMGVVLAPVTWVFGPVATLNVALTLSPALSALAMFVLLRRWVAWAPAAFVGGLAYGFSPFVLISLTDAHLMLAAAFVPPLLVAGLDEILIGQRHRAVVGGVTLGVLVAVQFFVGTEVLVITGIAAALGMVIVVAWEAVVARPALMARARHATVGLAAAAATSVALLAYPAWFALEGPARLAGRVWGTRVTSYGATNLVGYFLPQAASAPLAHLDARYGGYQAPTLSGQYVGLGVTAVLLLGLVLWRRDRRLWLFAAVGLASVLFSFGLRLHSWTPWRLFAWLPLLENIIPSRFLIVTYLSVAVMLGIIVDHVHTSVLGRRTQGPRRAGTKGRLAAALATLAVSAVALVPVLGYYAGGLPLTTGPVVLPAWFAAVAPTLPEHQVVLVFPVPFTLLQSAMTWQAVDGMRFSMVGGGGPGSIPSRAGRERAGQAVIARFSISAGPQPVTPGDIGPVRQALDGWGATTVVVPDPDHLPVYEQVHQVRSTVLLLTAATGQSPVRRAEAWVWTGVDRAGPALHPSAAALSQ